MQPLVPVDTDLRNFDFMPLKVAQLRDSDLAAIASAEEFRAAVMLWCASWHQVPASSLPDDDRMLCRLAGLGRDSKTWAEVREVALRGFVLCDDGRLYHSVIADLANAAWQQKRRNTERTKHATLARQQRNGQHNVDRGGNVTSTKGEGEGDRDGEGSLRILSTKICVELWNAFAKERGLPQVQQITKPRTAALNARLPTIGGIDGFKVLLEQIAKCPHLLGHNERGWRCDFDWVLKPNNFVKIMEGNYVGRARKNPAQDALDDLRQQTGTGH
jgi:hypothetical protein